MPVVHTCIGMRHLGNSFLLKIEKSTVSHRSLVQTYNNTYLKTRADSNDYLPKEYGKQLNVRALAAYGIFVWSSKVFFYRKW